RHLRRLRGVCRALGRAVPHPDLRPAPGAGRQPDRAGRGGPAGGRATERLGRRRVPLMTISGLNVLTWVALVVPATPISPGFMPLLCFLIGLGSSVVVLAFAAIREVNDQRYVGVALGFHNLAAV